MIIGICGAKGSGKSTTANILKELVPGAVDIAFADPMKEFCKKVFDFSKEQLWGPSEEREKPDERYPRSRPHLWVKAPYSLKTCARCRAIYCAQHSETCDDFLTPREALQQLGTEWGRACYPEVWVEYGIRRAKALLRPDLERWGGVSLVIVTDVRFQNEADAIRAAGGKVLRVTRPGCGTSDSHASEAEAATMDVDLEIPNDGTLDDLKKALALALEEHGL